MTTSDDASATAVRDGGSYRDPSGHVFRLDGRVLRTGTRVTSTLFRVQATVTQWRAYDVTGVRVSYSVPVRR